MPLLMVLGAALSFAVGGIFMQLSEGLSKPVPSLLVYLLFVVGASLQTLATRDSGLGLTYILVLGLEAVLAFLFGSLLFKETYSFVNIVGVILIVAGTACLRFVNA